MLYTNFKRIIFYLPLLTVCAASLSLVLPTINNNISDPNMIVYFNGDEGGLMDVIWHYYSGIKRESFQWDFDYGLEMVYLADVARLYLSKFIDFTPGTFVLILRWIHLVAWVLSFLALWRLISYHFGRGWQPLLAVILLAVRPAFAYFSVNLKPEPLVLFFMIIGLDYTLRVVEEPSKKNLVIAIACAALAFIIKYVGLFLLLAIVASMYLSELYQRSLGRKNVLFSRIKLFWILPALCGLALIMLPLVIILFYVRKSTGTTWYEECGLWASLLRNRTGLYSFIGGIFFIFLSGMLWFLNKNDNPFLKKIMGWIKRTSSFVLVVIAIFLGFVLLFGFRWIVSPKYFILAYAFLGSTAPAESINILAEKGFLYAFFHKLIERFFEFDPIMLLLFGFYLGLEIYYRQKHLEEKSLRLQMFKRFVLLVFLVPFLLLLGSMLRVGQHHMLPFFVAMSILAIQGIYMYRESFSGKKLLKNCVLTSIIILFLIDIFINESAIIKSRIYHFHQSEDIAYEIAKWWRENIPLDAKVVADHYNRVYIPPQYKNVKTLHWGYRDKVGQLRQLVDEYRPDFVYYNEFPPEENPMRPVEEVLPGKKVKLVKSFDNTGRSYQKWPRSKFVIYRIIY